MAYCVDYKQFVETAKKMLAAKTTYVLGAFGSPLSNTLLYNKGYSYSTNPYKTILQHWTDFNKTWNPTATVVFNNLSNPNNIGKFIGDCSGLVQACLCGWTGDMNDANGGCDLSRISVRGKACYFASYAGNSETYKLYPMESWYEMTPGEVLWQYDNAKSKVNHIAIYLGNGKCAEWAYNWYSAANMTDGVQEFELFPEEMSSSSYKGCPSKRKGANGEYGVSRYWAGHGKLAFVNYAGAVPDNLIETPYKRGDKVNLVENATWLSGAGIAEWLYKNFKYLYVAVPGKYSSKITCDSTLAAISGTISNEYLIPYEEKAPEEKTSNEIKVPDTEEKVEESEPIENEIENPIQPDQDKISALNQVHGLVTEAKNLSAKINSLTDSSIESAVSNIVDCKKISDTILSDLILLEERIKSICK